MAISSSPANRTDVTVCVQETREERRERDGRDEDRWRDGQRESKCGKMVNLAKGYMGVPSLHIPVKERNIWEFSHLFCKLKFFKIISLKNLHFRKRSKWGKYLTPITGRKYFSYSIKKNNENNE